MSDNSSVVPKKWTVVNEQLHADCKVYKIFQQRCKHPVRRTEADFYVVKGLDWVMSIPVTPEGDFLMVRQYRFGSAKLSWEFPGGCLNLGESPLSGGMRELQEETGFSSAHARSLGCCSPNPALQNNWVHFVLAEEATRKSEVKWDRNEELQIGFFSKKEILQKMKSGEIHHALTYAAFFYFLHL